MKIQINVLLISLSLVTGIAQAANSDVSTSKTRTQVLVELDAARAAGTLGHADPLDYPPHVFNFNPKTRAEVLVELDAARAAGTLGHADRKSTRLNSSH